MKRSILYRFFSLLVLVGFFLSCGNPVYTREESGGDEGGGSDSEAEGPALVSISVTRLPSKTGYEWGEELDISGLEVTGTYDDDSIRIEEVSRSNVSGYSATTEGAQKLRVSIKGKSATFSVVVWDFIKIKVNNPAYSSTYSIEAVLPSGSMGYTSQADWYIHIRTISGGAAPFAAVSPKVDGCSFTASFTTGTYEITVIFRETYSERFQIQVN